MPSVFNGGVVLALREAGASSRDTRSSMTNLASLSPLPVLTKFVSTGRGLRDARLVIEDLVSRLEAPASRNARTTPPLKTEGMPRAEANQRAREIIRQLSEAERRTI